MDRTCTLNQKFFLLILVSVFFTAELANRAIAQEAPAPTDNVQAQEETKSVQAEKDSRETTATDQSIPFLQLPSGKKLFINDQEKLDQLIKEIDQNSKNSIPEYSFNDVRMEGEVVEDHIDLNIHISLTVNQPEKAVEVPFFFNQGFLTKAPEYQGDGQLLQAGTFRKEGHGYSWWIQGKGKHQLTFPIRVKLIRQLNESRLQLTLPSSAISELTLAIPEKSIQAENITNGYLEQKTENDKTTLSAFLTGTNLDIRWHYIPENLQETDSMQSRTDINLQITDDSYLLDAQQTIEIRNGTFEEVGIQLPDHFELVDITSPLYHSHQIDQNRHVTLKFSKPVTDSVTIQWNLEAARILYEDSTEEKPESDILLNGFVLDNARKQSGTIGVYAPRGFHVSRDKDQSRNIYRINPYKIKFSPDVLSAYSFERQPFVLKLTTTKLPPNYSVEPYHALRFSEEKVELESLFRFEVPSNQSALKNIRFHWPEFKKSKWKIEPVIVPGIIDTINPGDIEPNGSFVISVSEDESNRSQTIEIPIRASIQLESDQKEISLNLPVAEATIQRDPVLIIEEDPNTIVSLLQSGNKSLKSLGINPNSDQFPIQFKQKEDARYYHSKPDDLSLQATISKRPLHIHSSAFVYATQKQDQISITQTIDFNVMNESIDQVELTVSNKELNQNNMEFLFEGIPIQPVITDSPEGQYQRITLNLPDDRIGEFQIQINYDLPDKNSLQKTHLDIPIFHPQFAGQFLSELTFEYSGMRHINANVSHKSWKKTTSLEGHPVWKTQQPSDTISLTLSDSPASFDYSIKKVLIRNEIQERTCYSRGDYLLSGKADDLTIKIPNGLEVLSIWWNEIQLNESNYFTIDNEFGNLRIISPSQDFSSTQNLLTINYRQSIDPPGILTTSCTLMTPEFPAKIWIDESVQEITLPFKNHLLTHPQGYDELFHWTRNWFYWDRQPASEFSNLNRWFQYPVGIVESGSGNSYAFHCHGSPQPLSFRSMTSSIIVLFGAGFALFTSFILIKIPVTRSIFSFFIFGLVLAFLRIWFEDSITLFIQPALLGLLLALLATTLEKRFKKEPAKNIVSLSSPSDLYLPTMPQSSVDHPHTMQAGSEDPTSVRHFSSNPLSKSDSGAH